MFIGLKHRRIGHIRANKTDTEMSQGQTAKMPEKLRHEKVHDPQSSLALTTLTVLPLTHHDGLDRKALLVLLDFCHLLRITEIRSISQGVIVI